MTQKSLWKMTPQEFWEEWWYAITTILRHAFYPLVFKRMGACNQCGRCCRHVYLRDHGRMVASFDEYLNMVVDDKKFSRFKVKGKDQQGFLYFSCTYINEKNQCGDYKRRPFLCRGYPDLGMIIYGAVPKEECGFYFVNRFTGRRVVS